jgi:preprotein translocase subunit SecG
MNLIPVVLAIHLMIAVALIGVILVQKSEGGALGMGGGGMSGFMTGRSAANLLTRTTAFLAAAFFVTSIGLALLASAQRGQRSIIDQVPTPIQSGPSGAPAPTTTPAAPTAPATPATPAAPLAK